LREKQLSPLRLWSDAIMTGNDELTGPLKARSDLVDILRMCPENTEGIITLILSELEDFHDSEVIAKVEGVIESAAAKAEIDPGTRDNVLYWLTETSPDARQMIMMRTIEDLLEIDQCRPAVTSALGKISSTENVKMVMEWVERKILTLNQAVYVLLFPDSSAALK
jgi:hypothetical protein